MLGTTSLVSMVVGILVIAVMFGALIHDIADNTVGLPNSTLSNISESAGSILDLVPLMLAVGVLLAVISLIGIRVTGKI